MNRARTRARDFWLRPADLEALRGDAPSARTLTLAGATHHVFLDHPDRGRSALIEELTRFLAVNRSSDPLAPAPVTPSPRR